jgi:antitoxin ParD1/3/4
VPLSVVSKEKSNPSAMARPKRSIPADPLFASSFVIPGLADRITCQAKLVVSYLLRTVLIADKVRGEQTRRLAMTTVTISLPESLKAFIEEQLATKGYGNVSEYFRSLLRAAQEREEESRLETLLVEGLVTGGNDIPLTREFWKDLKTEALDLAKKHQSRKKSS